MNKFLLTLLCLIIPSFAKIGIVVNKDLYPSVKGFLTQYVKDLSAIEKKKVWIDSTHFGAASTIASLRDTLRGRYSKDSLEGAVFIGDLPVAEFEMKEDFGDPTWGYTRFPTDLYFMDIDGIWSDTARFANAASGVFDEHTGNKLAEIWVSRIIPSANAQYGSDISIVSGYFNRIQKRMSGNDAMPSRALTFGNSGDWSTFDQEMVRGLGYPDSMVTHYIKPNDTRANWLKEIRKGYESTELYEHASSTYHTLSSDGYFDESDFRNMETTGGISNGRFYNLFNCSTARYTVQGFLGGLYAWGHSGLIAIGSTKTGSMLQFDSYNTELGAGKSYGEAYKKWFNTVIANGDARSDIASTRGWHYGMTLLGAGSLRMKPYAQTGTPVTINASVTVATGGTTVPAWNPNDPATSYKVGTQKTNGGRLWQVTNTAYATYEPSSTNGKLGWKDMGAVVVNVPGGTISPVGAVTVPYRSDKAFVFTPDFGKVVSAVKVDGKALSPIPALGYTFENLTANHTIAVTFAEPTNAWVLAVTRNLGAEVVSVQGSGTYTKNSAIEIRADIIDTVTYRFKAWRVTKGAATIVDSTKAITKITPSAHTEVTAIVERKQFYLAVHCTGRGTAAPLGITRVDNHSTQQIEFEGEEGYWLEKYSVGNAAGSKMYPLSGRKGFIQVRNMTGDSLVEFYFVPVIRKFDMNVSVPTGHGSASPLGITKCDSAKSAQVSFQADSGYTLQKVMVGNSTRSFSTPTAMGIIVLNNMRGDSTVQFFYMPQTYYEVVVREPTYGKITPVGTTKYAQGSNVSLTVEANPGFTIAYVSVDGVDQKLTGTKATLNISNIQASKVVTATFKPQPTQFQIEMRLGNNGSTIPAYNARVDSGSTFSLIVKANPGYTIERVNYDGVNQNLSGTIDTMIIPSVKSNAIVTATFVSSYRRYDLNVSVPTGNGTASPMGISKCDSATTTQVTFQADPGYTLQKVMVGNSTRTFSATSGLIQVTNMRGDSTVQFFFVPKPRQFDVAVRCSNNGKTSPVEGNYKADSGSVFPITVTANPGYTIAFVTVDGVSQNITGTSAVLNYQVKTNPVIIASFKPLVVAEPTWVKGQTYSAGNRVSWKNHNWEAKWWTNSEEPGATASSPWTDMGPI